MSFVKKQYDILRTKTESQLKTLQGNNVHSRLAVADNTGKILYSRGFAKLKKRFLSVIKLLNNDSRKQYLQNISLGISGIYGSAMTDKEIVSIQYCESGMIECCVIDFSGRGFRSLEKFRNQIEADNEYLDCFRNRNKIALQEFVCFNNFNAVSEAVINLYDFFTIRKRISRRKDEQNNCIVELHGFIKKVIGFASGYCDINIRLRSPKDIFALIPRDYLQAFIYQIALFIRFSKNNRLNISVKPMGETVSLVTSCIFDKNHSFNMHFNTVSGILSTFRFPSEFDFSDGLLVAKTLLPIPEDAPSILCDDNEIRKYTDVLLSRSSTENIFRFISDN